MSCMDFLLFIRSSGWISHPKLGNVGPIVHNLTLLNSACAVCTYLYFVGHLNLTYWTYWFLFNKSQKASKCPKRCNQQATAVCKYLPSFVDSWEIECLKNWTENDLVRSWGGGWSSATSRVARPCFLLPYPTLHCLISEACLPTGPLRRNLLAPLSPFTLSETLKAHNGDMNAETHSAVRHGAFHWCLQHTVHPGARLHVNIFPAQRLSNVVSPKQSLEQLR